MESDPNIKSNFLSVSKNKLEEPKIEEFECQTVRYATLRWNIWKILYGKRITEAELIIKVEK